MNNEESKEVDPITSVGVGIGVGLGILLCSIFPSPLYEVKLIAGISIGVMVVLAANYVSIKWKDRNGMVWK